MNVLIWHVHGSWTTNFVQGAHTYIVPVVDDRGPDGRGRARTWEWPSNAVELTPAELTDAPVDVVIVQRPLELELAERWLGRRPGRDTGLIWLEHNAPQGEINAMGHPARDRDDTIVVHVTHTNALFWDTGSTPMRVVEHGVVDPGERWTGECESIGVAINEPLRRGRVVGADLLPAFGAAAPIDLFGIGADQFGAALGRPSWLVAHDDPPQHTLHPELAQCRCYLHPFRWTSLGLTLIEAMLLGMPIVALATTEVPAAVPPECGFVSNDVDALVEAVGVLMRERERATQLGKAARAHALERYGLDRFLSEWDAVLEEACR